MSPVRAADPSASGLITTWSANPGGPLAPRISTQTGKVSAGKMTVTLNTAYATNNGDLSVTYAVRNKSSKKTSITITGYISPDGCPVKVSTTPYLADPAPGSFSTNYATIVGGARGAS